MATEAGDAEARGKLVSAFLPAIASLAGRFPRSKAVEFEELVDEGVAGLLFASRRYDPRLTTPFWAYASFWVRKAMQELVAELARPVALSDRAVRHLARIKSARREHLSMHRVEPTDDELSTATGLTRAQIESLQAAERAPKGIEEPLWAGTASTPTFGETIADPTAERAYDQVLDDIECRELRQLADELNGRERAVINAHYGLDRPAQSLNQIGGELGLTAERARQIEIGALGKLRASLAGPARTC